MERNGMQKERMQSKRMQIKATLDVKITSNVYWEFQENQNKCSAHRYLYV